MSATDRRKLAVTRDATDGVQLLLAALKRMSVKGQRSFARRVPVQELVRLLCHTDGESPRH
jgi:hypothetical protein